MSKEQALLPCPFCGYEASMTQVESAVAGGRMIWVVGCNSEDCEVGFHGHARRVDAAKAWNTRTRPDAGNDTDLIEQYEAMLQDAFTHLHWLTVGGEFSAEAFDGTKSWCFASAREFGDAKEWIQTHRSIFERLRKSTAQQVADARSHWVAVSERLPDAPQTGPQAKCLVTVLCPDGSLEVLPSGYWNDAGWALEARWKAEETSGFQIVAWMPRPEPHKQGETE